MKYVFTMDYTNDDKYKFEVEADEPITAWYKFFDKAKGFIMSGNVSNEGYLEKIKVTVS